MGPSATPRLRVAIVDNSGGGGALHAARAMASGLAARGHAVDLWAPPGGPAAPPAGVRLREGPRFAPWLDLGQLSVAASPLGPLEAVRLRRAYGALAGALDAEGYDVVMPHACRFVEHPWLAGAVRAPLVVYVHALPRFVGDDAPGRDLARRVAVRALRPWQHRLAASSRAELRAAAIVLANSRYTARALETAYGVQARVAYPGVDAQVFAPLDRPRERTVLFPGLLCRQKRQELLVDSIARLAPARRPRLVLFFTAAAIGFERRLRARARAAGVALDLRRDPSRSELVEAYNRAGVVAVPSAREAFGLVALEAMACGAAVVAAAEGGMLETVEDGVTGRLVEPEAGAFARALEALLDDEPERARLGAAGRARALERWTWARTVDVVEAALQEARRGRDP